MSFVGPGQVVTYLYWIEQVQKLGLGDASTPSELERRMFEESGEFNLKVYNSGWVKCNRNADLLNSQPGTFYLNASNMNAGTLARGRLGYLCRKSSYYINNPLIQMDTFTCTTIHTWYTVTFNLAFSAGTTPIITTGIEKNDTDIISIRTRNITSTGFQVISNRGSTIVHFTATGDKP